MEKKYQYYALEICKETKQGNETLETLDRNGRYVDSDAPNVQMTHDEALYLFNARTLSNYLEEHEGAGIYTLVLFGCNDDTYEYEVISTIETVR